MITHCPVCGYGPFNSAYASADELRSSYDICECCGCEYGYDDNEKHYQAWVNQGCQWFDTKCKPTDWQLKSQIPHIIRPWPFRSEELTMPHDDGLNELSVALTAAGIVNQLFHDCIHITFQKENAMIDIKAWEDGGRSVQIFQEGKWHNLVTVPGEFECQPHDAVSRLIKKFTERGLESSHASNRIHKA